MKRLEKLSGLADLRFSPMLHLPVAVFSLWDFHVLWSLEGWQLEVGRSCREWLDCLAQGEALCALSTLAHDNPDWCLPRVDRDLGARFLAVGLAHPLLPPDASVANDVELGPVGTFLLVTGSNMSGKSTLLRAIGLSAALAGAGGAVCAEELSLGLFELRTSFRISDSIRQGVSFFMAELQRLKAIVDRADALRESDERGLLFLLDEILQGTNAVERQIAVRTVLAHLVSAGAIGAVSTHDLSLADAEGLAGAAHTVYFTESFHEGDEGPQMSFDYRLREGVAPTVNAIKLLRIVGLT